MGIEDDGFTAAFEGVVNDENQQEETIDVDAIADDVRSEIDDTEIAENTEVIENDDIPEPIPSSSEPTIPEVTTPDVPIPQEAEFSPHLPDPTYSDEEQEFLKTYGDEWAEVSKGEALKRRHEYTAIVNYVMEQMAQQVAPLQKAVEKYESVLKKQEILKSHDDYDSIQPQLMQWADKQPSYLRDAYKNVITRGNIEDVNDLIVRFKQETAPPSRVKSEELSPRTDKAVQKLAIVNSRRSGPTQVDDPMDYEAAFEKASKLAR